MSEPIAYNGYGLLLCWYFIMFSPEPQPIEKLMMKITTKAHLYSSDQTAADSEQNDENMFVSQHRSKPNVSWRNIVEQGHKIEVCSLCLEVLQLVRHPIL